MASTSAPTEDQKRRLGVALNEAAVIGVEVNLDRRTAAVTFAPLTRPERTDPRVLFLLSGVRRVAASFRKGLWNDAEAEVEPFEVTDLLPVVRSFDGQSIYGWDFFDLHATELAKWGNRLSLDWRPESDEGSQSLLLFQESLAGPTRHLDLLIWFDALSISDADGEAVSVDEFVAAGERWWNSFQEKGEAREGLDLEGLAELPAI